MAITIEQFINNLKNMINFPSVYAWAQMGSPISDSIRLNKFPYNNVVQPVTGETTRAYAIRRTNAYGSASKLIPTIQAAAEGTFAFDCSGMIMAALCNWSADATDCFGGGNPSNLSTRYTAESFADLCGYPGANPVPLTKEQWDTLKPGDLMFQTAGAKTIIHCGVYLGDGLVIESAYPWLNASYGMKNGIQISKIIGYNATGKTMRTCPEGFTGERGWIGFGTLPDSILNHTYNISWNDTLDFSAIEQAQELVFNFKSNSIPYNKFIIDVEDLSDSNTHIIKYNNDVVYREYDDAKWLNTANKLLTDIAEDPTKYFTTPALAKFLADNITNRPIPPDPPPPAKQFIEKIIVEDTEFAPYADNNFVYIPQLFVDMSGHHVYYLKIDKNLFK